MGATTGGCPYDSMFFFVCSSCFFLRALRGYKNRVQGTGYRGQGTGFRGQGGEGNNYELRMINYECFILPVSRLNSSLADRPASGPAD